MLGLRKRIGKTRARNSGLRQYPSLLRPTQDDSVSRNHHQCRPSFHSERAPTSSEPEDDTGSLRTFGSSRNNISLSALRTSASQFSSTSTACSILPNTQPSPIAEFPAREAAALQEDVNAIPAPAIAAKTPLSQEVKLVRHFQALQDINTEIFRLGYRGMRLLSGDLQCRRDQPRRGRIARIKTVSKPKSALLYSIQVEQPGPVPQELSQGAQADCRRVLLRPGGQFFSQYHLQDSFR
ncbi:hypothetical protein JOM56_009673 [Amanita muscaria]